MNEKHRAIEDQRPTDSQIITRAIEMLQFGILSTNLLDRLMDEFGLTPDHARKLAEEAIKLHQKPGRWPRWIQSPSISRDSLVHPQTSKHLFVVPGCPPRAARWRLQYRAREIPPASCRL